MIVTDEVVRMLFCGATTPGSTADITQAHQAGLLTPLKNSVGVWILADAGYQGLGARTAGQVVTPLPEVPRESANLVRGHPHTPTQAHSSQRIRVEHGIAHLKNWRSLTRHLSRR